MTPAALATRNAEIVREYLAGYSLRVVGDRYGITRERVRQIAARAGAHRESVDTLAARRRIAVAVTCYLDDKQVTITAAASRAGTRRAPVASALEQLGLRRSKTLKRDQHGQIACYVHGRCRCAECRHANADQRRDYHRERSRAFRRAGRCGCCGREPVAGRAMCHRCRATQRAARERHRAT